MPEQHSEQPQVDERGIWIHVRRASDGRVRITHGPGAGIDKIHGDFYLSDAGTIDFALALLRESIEVDPEYVQLRVLASLANLQNE